MRTWCLFALLLLFFSQAVLQADGCFTPDVGSSFKLDPNGNPAPVISEPTQTAVIAYSGGVERMILQVSYSGSVSEFAWLVPTPTKPKVKEYDKPLLPMLEQATAPRIGYWGSSDRLLANLTRPPIRATRTPDVEVLERKDVGPFDVSILQARNASDLTGWLRENGYHVLPEYEPIFSEYIENGWIFTASRIKPASVGQVADELREGTIVPLQFDFQVDAPVYPLKISSLNTGTTKIVVYAVGEHRSDAAPLSTDCVLSTRQMNDFRFVRNLKSFVFEDMPGAESLGRRGLYITKLSAELSSDEMKADIPLVTAESDASVPPVTTSPSVPENVGATLALAMTVPFAMPFNILTGIACIWFGVKKASKRWRPLWIVSGIVISISLNLLTFPFSFGPPYSRYNWLLLIPTLYMLFIWRPKPQSAETRYPRG